MQILAYPSGQFLSIEEQDLVWKYRFFLSQQDKALAKFLQCVHWDKDEEVKQAVDLLQQWVTMNTEDALELLGPAYHHPKVRSYAVSRLQQAPDEVRDKKIFFCFYLKKTFLLGSYFISFTISSSSSL